MNLKINKTMKKIISHGINYPGSFTIKVTPFNPRDEAGWVLKGSEMMLKQAEKLVKMGILKKHSHGINKFKLLEGNFINGIDRFPENLLKLEEMYKLINK